MQTTAALRQTREAPPVPAAKNAQLVALERPSNQGPRRNRADMPVAVYQLALACWAAFLGVFWITFAFSGHATFMVAISTVYALMFFGVPAVLTRMTPADVRNHQGLSAFLRGRFDTLYGSISGFDAVVQVIVVPACLTLGGIAIGVIIHAARLAH